jgi:glutamate synthase (NADPH/NADH) large chain
MSERTQGSAGVDLLADPEDYRANCGVGVVFDLDGDRSHEPIADGLDLLENLEHRGTTGAEENTGDGAGIKFQLPHEFFADEVEVDLPEPGSYAVGTIFFPQDNDATADLQAIAESQFEAEGLDVLTWRSVPQDSAALLGRSTWCAAAPSPGTAST